MATLSTIPLRPSRRPLRASPTAPRFTVTAVGVTAIKESATVSAFYYFVSVQLQAAKAVMDSLR